MKRKNTLLAAIVLSALFVIVCFAVKYEQNQKYEERLDYAKAVWETSVRVQPECLYCRQPGGDFADAEAKAEEARARFLNEVAVNVSVTEPMGLTYEEFLAKMEKLDEEYNNSNYFSTNAKVMFEAATEGGYRETLIPSIICLETVGATRMKGENNSWNATEKINSFESTETYEEWRGRIKFTDFDSSEDAIETLSHRLEEVTCSATNLKEFAEIWDLSIDDATYATCLYRQMQKIEDL